jgi:thioredoxin 1
MKILKYFIVTLTVFTVSLILVAQTVTARAEILSSAGLEQAQKKGEKIALFFHASWCPVCKRQGIFLSEIAKEPTYQSIRFLKADYDSETELKKSLGVKKQTTLILFSGKKEISRTQGVSDKDKLIAELQKLLEEGE